MRLDEIAIKHGCDKSSKHHDYCKVYERYLEVWRDDEINLLELGYGGYEYPDKGGESARMWREYFTAASITVTDIHDKHNIPSGVCFIQTPQDTNSETLEYSPYDVIIDDASHYNGLTIEAFKQHWSLLKPGGLYFIEDIHSSYDPYYHDSNPNPDCGDTIMNFLKRLADELNSDFIQPQYHLGYRIGFIHFYREFCVIMKA